MQDVAGKSIVTIEGLSADGKHPVQRAWVTIASLSAATARPARSCRPLRSLPRRLHRQTSRSMMRWAAICADAAPTTASARPFTAPPRGPDHGHRKCQPAHVPRSTGARRYRTRAWSHDGTALRGRPLQPTTCFRPNVYLSIDQSGLVTIVSHRTEMGQGIRTSTTMVVADELEADWARIRVVQATATRITAARIRTDRTASATSCSRSGKQARARARCSNRRPRRAGASLSAKSARAITRSCTKVRDARSVTGHWHRQPPRFPFQPPHR